MTRLSYPVVMLILAVAGCVSRNPEVATSNNGKMTTTLDDSAILQMAGQNSEVAKFISENPDYTHELTKLAPRNITTLAQKYPAVYGSLPNKTLYRIDYGHGGRGLLVIVDPESGETSKYFRSVGVSLT
jgi:hypothetical protein